jgi:hypothetical protein
VSSGAVLEAPTLIAGLDDVAVVSEAIEQRGGHLRIAEHAGPFAESEICCDDDRRASVETADQVEQELAGKTQQTGCCSRKPRKLRSVVAGEKTSGSSASA